MPKFLVRFLLLHTMVCCTNYASAQNQSVPLGAPSYYTSVPGPYYLQIADLDGDGFQDAVTGSLVGAEGISILYGRGDGTFTPADPIIPTVVTNWGSYAIKIGDLNGDQKPDIVVSHLASYTGQGTDNSVMVLINQGNRVFSSKPYKLIVTSPAGPLDVALADVNHDGRMDIISESYWISASNRNGSVSAYLQDSNGEFGIPTGDSTQHLGIESYAGNHAEFISVGDFNKDGNPDIVVANNGHLASQTYSTSILLGDGTGSFSLTHQYGSNDEVGGVTVGDINQDNNLDFVQASITTGSVRVYLGDGAGNFSLSSSVSVGGSPILPAIGDVNNDGHPDVLVPNVGYLSIAFGDGTGQMPTIQNVMIDSRAISIATADLNGDNRPDIITAGHTGPPPYPGRITVLLNLSDTIAPTVTYSQSPPANAAGWNNTDVAVTLSATDNAGGSGVASITYAVNGGTATTVNGTSVTLPTFTAEGIYTLTCFATDKAGNASTTPPKTLKIDKTAPILSPSPPGSNTFLLNGSATLSFNPSDALSGLASQTVGAVDTSSVGSKTATCTATDRAGNTATFSVPYTVSYGVSVLFDETKAHKSGTIVPIRLQLIDANGVNVSSPSVTVNYGRIVRISTAAGSSVEELYAVADTDFVYNGGGYRFNLSTKGYPTGTYRLEFTASGDPITHAVQFQVK